MALIPFAERQRPKTLEQFWGQNHLVGKGAVLRRLAESGQIHSMVFWGPPGTGKTTLARILANAATLPFIQLSAISSGVKELREAFEQADKLGGAVLFIDEIHRFNKTQQDTLLKSVEEGKIVLLGATTENPSFELNKAILSRTQVYVLKSLTNEELVAIAKQALSNDVELSQSGYKVMEWDALLNFADGDARKLLNLLELCFSTSGMVELTNKLVIENLQQGSRKYDKSGEQHYDIISAFIKSLRGSDPNAAIYWMARMLEGGEQPTFIARRMCILASEDIGLANPNALLLATSCFQAVDMVGMPEAEIILGQTAVYLATSPKSNASYKAIKEARAFVRQTGDLEVPLHLRNAPTGLMKKMGYGDGYKYAHDFPGNFVAQDFLPTEIKGKQFYSPQQNSKENEILTRLKAWWKGFYKY